MQGLDDVTSSDEIIIHHLTIVRFSKVIPRASSVHPYATDVYPLRERGDTIMERLAELNRSTSTQASDHRKLS